MTTKGNGREPSMDEIMAQIRSIIAADETKVGRQAAPRPADNGGKATDGDVLELTEMVNDDGSVTKVAKNDAGEVKPRTIEPQSDADFDLGDQAVAELQPVFATNNPPPPSILSPPPAPPMAPPMAQDAPQPRPAPAKIQPVIYQSPPAQAFAPPPIPPAQAANPAPVPPMPIQPAPAQAAPQPGAMNDMLSNAAAGAAAAALQRLAAVNQQQQAAAQQAQPRPAPAPQMPAIGGRSIEEVVVQALRPMLKQWIDANLPQMVERMVAQEIAKITKR